MVHSISQPAFRPTMAHRLILCTALTGGAWLGLLLMTGDPVTGAPVTGEPAQDRALLTLLRFMATVKGAMALGTAGALWWRLHRPAGAGVIAAYSIAASTMAAGPFLIWAGSHVALGAALVHGGALLGALTAWRDRARWRHG